MTDNTRNDYWSTSLGDLEISQCAHCARRRESDIKAICDAFPDGIPEVILANDVDHRKPYEGDHGLQFVPLQSD